MQHFPDAWELHCIAVRADARGRGRGRALSEHAESRLASKDARWLQGKTLAATRAVRAAVDRALRGRVVDRGAPARRAPDRDVRAAGEHLDLGRREDAAQARRFGRFRGEVLSAF